MLPADSTTSTAKPPAVLTAATATSFDNSQATSSFDRSHSQATISFNHNYSRQLRPQLQPQLLALTADKLQAASIITKPSASTAVIAALAMSLQTFLPMGEKPPDKIGRGYYTSRHQHATAVSLPLLKRVHEEDLALIRLMPSSTSSLLIVIFVSNAGTFIIPTGRILLEGATNILPNPWLQHLPSFTPGDRSKLEQSTSHPVSTAPVIKAFAPQPAPTILNLWSITVQKQVALNPSLIQSFKSNQNPSAKPSMLPSSKSSHNPSATLSKDPSKPCQKLITKPSQAPLDPQLSPSGSHYPCPDTTHRIYFTKNFYTTDTSSTAYLSRPVFHSPLIHTNLDFYHDFDIASRVALSAPFGIASLLQSVFHPTTLSSYYPEHIITLSSNDSELERDYIAHCTAYSHLTQATCN
jgi:hypothetical protein